jgi:hypothetical protein
MPWRLWGYKNMQIGTRHTTVCIGAGSNLDLERLKAEPSLELYYVSGPDVREPIDLALLDHLHCQRAIVFVGGEQAKLEAQAYGVQWIEDTPAVNDALLEFWRTATPELDSP